MIDYHEAKKKVFHYVWKKLVRRGGKTCRDNLWLRERTKNSEHRGENRPRREKKTSSIVVDRKAQLKGEGTTPRASGRSYASSKKALNQLEGGGESCFRTENTKQRGRGRTRGGRVRHEKNPLQKGNFLGVDRHAGGAHDARE